jgi:hypothetical protein
MPARNSRLTPAQIDAGLAAARMGSCPDRICRRLRLCLGAGVTVVIDSHQGRWAAASKLCNDRPCRPSYVTALRIFTYEKLPNFLIVIAER